MYLTHETSKTKKCHSVQIICNTSFSSLLSFEAILKQKQKHRSLTLLILYFGCFCFLTIIITNAIA